MTLRERRCAFTHAVIRLLYEARRREWSYGDVEFAFDEGTVKNPRKIRVPAGFTTEAEDAVHRRGSRHYEGLALDLLVYINGVYVTSSEHPIWREMDAMARAIDPRLSFGIEFHDANHLSWEEGDPALTPSVS